jgi:hemolysin D
VLVTLVPQDEPLWAEVSIENKDIGFVAIDQPVRVKLLTYEFQKYGMLEGTVRNVSADSTAGDDLSAANGGREVPAPVFTALIELGSQELPANGLALPLAAGMQVSAEIKQGERTVLEYLLSPVQRVASEAGKER